jgi:hypothetical protein
VAGILIRIWLVSAALAVILLAVSEFDRARLGAVTPPAVRPEPGAGEAAPVRAPERQSDASFAVSVSATLAVVPAALPMGGPFQETRSAWSMASPTPASGVIGTPIAFGTPIASPTVGIGATGSRVTDEWPARLGFAAPPAGFESVSMHVAPSTAAARVTTVPSGQAVELLGQSASGDGYTWTRVRSADGREGWLIAGALRVPD